MQEYCTACTLGSVNFVRGKTILQFYLCIAAVPKRAIFQKYAKPTVQCGG